MWKSELRSSTLVVYRSSSQTMEMGDNTAKSTMSDMSDMMSSSSHMNGTEHFDTASEAADHLQNAMHWDMLVSQHGPMGVLMAIGMVLGHLTTSAKVMWASMGISMAGPMVVDKELADAWTKSKTMESQMMLTRLRENVADVLNTKVDETHDLDTVAQNFFNSKASLKLEDGTLIWSGPDEALGNFTFDISSSSNDNWQQVVASFNDNVTHLTSEQAHEISNIISAEDFNPMYLMAYENESVRDLFSQTDSPVLQTLGSAEDVSLEAVKSGYLTTHSRHMEPDAQWDAETMLTAGAGAFLVGAGLTAASMWWPRDDSDDDAQSGTSR